jgi:hypothetical protein
MVTRSITALAPRIAEHGGHLVKTLGDGLMAVFEQPGAAVESALAMQETLAAHPWDPELPDGPRGAGLQLQVAIASGEIAEVAGDCYGDAVNVAARLLDHAGDHEMLITAEVLAGLPPEQRSRFLSLDKVRLRGRNEPVEVHLLAHRGSETAATQLQTQFDLNEACGVRLVWQGEARDFLRTEMPVLVGRSSDATLRIDDARVSRRHVRIDVLGAAMQLTDLSINGTYLRYAGDDEVLSLRRGACTLHGSGAIGLGGSPDDQETPTLAFEVLQAPLPALPDAGEH